MKEMLMLDRKVINELLGKLVTAGVRVMAPVRKGEKTIFSEISAVEEMAADYIQTTMSAKEAIFPRYEEILHYENKNQEIIIDDERNRAVKTVVFGTRPCDGRAIGVMDAVFDGDYVDTFYHDKRNNTVIISVGCSRSDEYCFCTTVGGGPGDTAGSDILLTETGGGRFLAEVLTDRGREIIDMVRSDCTAATDADMAEKSGHLADVQVSFDMERVMSNMKVSFEDQIFVKQSLRCIGCGVCSYVCPSCTCFDIQDEYDGPRGIRLRCWDSCGFGHFTLHTSWHNPRHEQSKRWRQRLMHKFHYQPDTLHLTGCTGCGRCSRSCPTSMIITNHLKAIANLEPERKS